VIVIGPQIVFNVKKLINIISKLSESSISINISVHIHIIYVPNNLPYICHMLASQHNPHSWALAWICPDFGGEKLEFTEFMFIFEFLRISKDDNLSFKKNFPFFNLETFHIKKKNLEIFQQTFKLDSFVYFYF
jgi:hypothetical protein